MPKLYCPKCGDEIAIDHASEADLRCCPKCGVLAVAEKPAEKPKAADVVAVAEQKPVDADASKKSKKEDLSA